MITPLGVVADLERRRQCRRLDGQRVVAGGGEWRRQAGEHADP